MRTRLFKPCARHPHEDCLLLQFFNRMRAAVTHPRLQAADQLREHFARFAAVRDGCLHSFRHIIFNLFLREVIAFAFVAFEVCFQ